VAAYGEERNKYEYKESEDMNQPEICERNVRYFQRVQWDKHSQVNLVNQPDRYWNNAVVYKFLTRMKLECIGHTGRGTTLLW
jgi:hypothetical protein